MKKNNLILLLSLIVLILNVIIIDSLNINEDLIVYVLIFTCASQLLFFVFCYFVGSFKNIDKVFLCSGGGIVLFLYLLVATLIGYFSSIFSSIYAYVKINIVLLLIICFVFMFIYNFSKKQ